LIPFAFKLGTTKESVFGEEGAFVVDVRGSSEDTSRLHAISLGFALCENQPTANLKH